MRPKDKSVFRAKKLAIPSLIGITLMLPVCAFALLVYYFESSPVKQDFIDRIEPGMTKDEVVSILGHPHRVYANGREWQYHRPLSWSWLSIWFDDNGEVEECETDD